MGFWLNPKLCAFSACRKTARGLYHADSQACLALKALAAADEGSRAALSAGWAPLAKLLRQRTAGAAGETSLVDGVSRAVEGRQAAAGGGRAIGAGAAASADAAMAQLLEVYRDSQHASTHSKNNTCVSIIALDVDLAINMA